MTGMNRLAGRVRQSFVENVRFAFRAMWEHRLRSALTTLGIVVGVATVIVMVAVITGFNNLVISNFQAFGATRIGFTKYRDHFGPPGPQSEEERRRKNLTIADVASIRGSCPSAGAVSALAGYFDADIHVRNGNAEANSPYVLGTDSYYPAANAYGVAQGRFFTAAEVDHHAFLAVIGSEVQEAIFPGVHAVGRSITVNGVRYRVLGVLDRKGEQFGYSPDNKVVLPLGTFVRQFGSQVRKDGVRISCVPIRPEAVGRLIEEATAVLRQRRRVSFDRGNDFETETPDQLIGQFRAITGGVTGAMMVVALISLAVGGVGVMTIMLASVTQRTREIGIRKALGARRRDIVRQFTTEAVTLTGLGGVGGVLCGVLVARGVRAAVSSLPTEVPLWSALVGLLVSTAVGLFLGLYPALRAARVDPIEALRYE
ncbi:MAG: ABC transporter permease [Acidobacteria bacterium]|nr:ABC transporter permease [Acidobacteriota bacterium]